MIVEFRNTFRVPGFGRKRFPKGVVRDVPEGLRSRLPSSAEILPEDHPTEEQILAQEEITLANQDLLRQQGTDEDVLAKAGFVDSSKALSKAAFDEAVNEKVKEQVDAALETLTAPETNSNRKQGGKKHA